MKCKETARDRFSTFLEKALVRRVNRRMDILMVVLALGAAGRDVIAVEGLPLDLTPPKRLELVKIW